MRLLIYPLLALVLASCTRTPHDHQSMEIEPEPGTFAYDRAFLKTYNDVLELKTANGKSRVLIVGAYQGRVMTSTAKGDSGKSYGWINYALIQSQTTRPQINPYGGEDRFWLGPEGGQFALYFKKGDPFDFEHWFTPPLIDTEPFELVDADSTQAKFKRSAAITNYAGYTFQMEINRQVGILEPEAIEREFGIYLGNLEAVGFQSLNSITNTGETDWAKGSGLPSIWILGMFNPSDQTVIIVPHESSDNPEFVTDNYFGLIPPDRIIRSDTLLLLKGDGKYRCKVGIAPSIARNITGSYDAGNHVLTLVKFDIDSSGDYVNSKWEHHKDPYKGDVLNSYNDGPLQDGSQLGPFYELESSSPVRELKRGESLVHRHLTLHLEGPEAQLNQVAEKTLGLSLDQIKTAFKP